MGFVGSRLPAGTEDRGEGCNILSRRAVAWAVAAIRWVISVFGPRLRAVHGGLHESSEGKLEAPKSAIFFSWCASFFTIIIVNLFCQPCLQAREDSNAPKDL